MKGMWEASLLEVGPQHGRAHSAVILEVKFHWELDPPTALGPGEQNPAPPCRAFSLTC